jgi:DNA mismatch repair protein MSH5
VDEAGGFFQIRPHKEFQASKGRDRLVSLSLLSDLDLEEDQENKSPKHMNAYNFMRVRRESTGDPTSKKWNASVRLPNFASVENSPLCVRSRFFSMSNVDVLVQLASIGALLDHLVRERAVGAFDDEGIHGLDIRGIEIISL